MIKNILFDLGGVLMDLDVPKTIQALNHIGINDIVNNTGHEYKHPFFYEFERGNISETIFLIELSNLSKQNNNLLRIKRAWNEMILNITEEKVDLLKKLKPNYNLFLLSNTNAIHQRKFLNNFNNRYGYSLNKLFKKAYYSHEIRKRKPDIDTYKYVLQDAKIKANETLFIDDSSTNLNEAYKCGINIFQARNNNLPEIFDLLKTFEEEN
ncbi:HAD family hydrolase [Tenacibaculum xiamenense]|uniref:HAD family hydrolase n=1 Tax=Tenacibaculum xiamenense TaxID=1261553 RepID=UPI0038968263